MSSHPAASEDPQVFRLKQAIKKTLRMRGLTYDDVASLLGVSSPTIKRSLGTGELTLDRAAALAQALGLSLFDLMELARNGDDGANHLSDKQETFLARHVDAMRYFMLLLGGWRPLEIEARFALPRVRTLKLLTALEGQDLLRFRGETLSVVLRIPRPLWWRPKGPLRERYGDELLTRCFARIVKHRREDPESFAADHLSLFLGLSLTPRDYAELRRRIADVAREALARSLANKSTRSRSSLVDVTGIFLLDAFDQFEVVLPDLR